LSPKKYLPSSVKSILRELYRRFRRTVRLATASQRKLPDFIIIGAQKSGSSTLYWWLYQHPQLAMSFDKETKFFDRHFNKGVNWYRHQFPLSHGNNKLAGDNTPYYIFHPLVPERIYKTCPKAKLILILRNPVDRAYSQFQMERRKGRETHDTFEAAIEGEMQRIKQAKAELLKAPLKNNHNHENTSYLSRGKYVEQVRDWLKWFDREQLLVLESELIFANPALLKTVYSFLNVENVPPTDLSAYNIVHYSTMPNELRIKLNQFFDPYNRELEQVLNMKFNWGTL